MNVYVDDIVRIESAEGIKAGQYEGLWSGFEVIFETGFGKYVGKSSVGVKGFDVPCIVTVNDNSLVEVKAI